MRIFNSTSYDCTSITSPAAYIPSPSLFLTSPLLFGFDCCSSEPLASSCPSATIATLDGTLSAGPSVILLVFPKGKKRKSTAFPLATRRRQEILARVTLFFSFFSHSLPGFCCLFLSFPLRISCSVLSRYLRPGLETQLLRFALFATDTQRILQTFLVGQSGMDPPPLSSWMPLGPLSSATDPNSPCQDRRATRRRQSC